MLWSAGLKAVLLVHIQCCQLIKVVHGADFKLGPNIGD